MDLVIRLSDWLYSLLNGIAGRSWLLDTLISLPLDNNLVKAASATVMASGRNQAAPATETVRQSAPLPDI